MQKALQLSFFFALASNTKSYAIANVFAFVCNPKSFTVATVFLLIGIFGQNGKSFLLMFYLLLPKMRVTSKGFNFIWHTEKRFSLNCSLSCYLRRVRPMTFHVIWVIHCKQHSQYPKKNKELPEARKQDIS